MDEKDAAALGAIAKRLARMIVNVRMESAALRMACFSRGVAPREEYESALQELRREVAPILDKLDRAPDQDVLELLQSFEGPIQ